MVTMRQLHGCVVLLIASVVNPCARMSSQNFKSYISGRAISIPSQLMSGNKPANISIDDKVCFDCNLIKSTTIRNQLEISDINPDVDPTIAAIVKHALATFLSADYTAIIEKTPSENFDISEHDEVVNLITLDGLPLCPFSRKIIHKYNMLHRGIGAVILNRQRQIFVHKRAETKRVFPSMYDMFIGGVNQANESPAQTLLREIQEEIGLNFFDSSPSSQENIPPLTQVPTNSPKDRKGNGLLPIMDTLGSERKIVSFGQCVVQTNYNHCLVDCYLVFCDDSDVASIVFSDGEISEGRWMSLDELGAMVAGEREMFVPDGLQVWDALPSMLRAHSSR